MFIKSIILKYLGVKILNLYLSNIFKYKCVYNYLKYLYVSITNASL